MAEKCIIYSNMSSILSRLNIVIQHWILWVRRSLLIHNFFYNEIFAQHGMHDSLTYVTVQAEKRERKQLLISCFIQPNWECSGNFDFYSW